jgi:molybdenum cofactor cytidylyltransferase
MPDLSLKQFDVILLAAGSSRRFGPNNKLTKPFRGRPLIEHILRTLDATPMGRRIIVTAQATRDDIVPFLVHRPGWEECINSHAERGVGTSIAAGASLLTDSPGVFVCPADMPLLTSADFAETAALHIGDDSICRPLFGGNPGHPVLFGRAHYPDLCRLDGDQGGSALLMNAANVSTFLSPNPGVTRDFDTADQFSADAE